MIVVAGEVLVDLVVSADGGVDPRLGGGPYNAARTLARLGAATTFFGGLADDRFGRLLRGALTPRASPSACPARRPRRPRWRWSTSTRRASPATPST